MPPQPRDIEATANADPHANRWLSIWIRLALIALVLTVYCPVLGVSFNPLPTFTGPFGYVEYDDPEYVTEVAHVQRGLSWPSIAWAFTTDQATNWHPITWLSLMLDSDVHRWLSPLFGGLGFWSPATVHHAVNILLHAANVLVLFGVLHRMTGMTWRSAIVAGLLAAHPMHVESVAWISERKDVLSMLFWLLAMRAYACFADERSVGNYLLVCALAALAMMAKPMTVTLPCALLLLDLWPLQRMVRPALTKDFARCFGLLVVEKLPLVIMSIAVAAVTVIVQRQEGVLTEGRWTTLPERLEMSVIGYARYLGKLFWPADLAALYPNLAPLGIDQWTTAQVAAASGLIAVISLAAVVALRRAAYFSVGWLWFLGTLVPVIGLVQIGRQSIADRYTYIPYIGLYIALVWLAGDALAAFGGAARRAVQRLGVAAACAAIITLAVVAHRQVFVWQNSLTLFSHAVEVTDRNWMMLNNLAAMLAKEDRQEEALQRLEAALEICRDCAWVHEHYGEMLSRAGRLYEAQLAFERAVALDPDYELARTNLGMVLSQRGQIASALPHLQRAVELKPTSADARKNLAIALALNGDTAEALEQVQEAIRLNPAGAAEYQVLIETIRAPGAVGGKPRP